MQVVDGRGLIFDAPNPHIIAASLKKAMVTNDGRVLAHWNMDNVMALNALGYPAPSRIAANYDYPGRDPVREHQRRMAEFMTVHKRCFNFSEMGTGKSRASLWAMDFLLASKLIKRVLVLSPLSIVKTAWEADLFATAMHRTMGIAVGEAKRRAAIIGSSLEVIIANHDTVKHSRIELARADFDLIIVDEATAFSDATTDRWKALNSLIKPHTRLWMLTGTPAANSPLQAYGLAKLVSPDRVPKFFSGWREKVMLKVSNFTWVPRHNARDIVFEALQPAIRIEKKDCLELPPVTYVDRLVEMEKQQQDYYKKMKQNMLMYVAGKEITAVNSGVLMGKLLQIASGTVYSNDGSVVDFRAGNRLSETLQIIHECEQKVIIFANYKHTLHTIRDYLLKHHIPCAVIDGDVPLSERTAIINSFQNDEQYQVLVLQPKVASHGITLTAASVVVWFTPTSSLETWRQANDRINRMGQKNKMTIVKLIGAPIEQRVYNVLEKRDADQTELLAMYRAELASE